MPKTLHIQVHLLGQPISSLNSLHAIIDKSVVTDFRVCTECQWPLVKDKVGIFVSCWSPSWSSWNLRSVVVWLNFIVLCCFLLRSLSRKLNQTTTATATRTSPNKRFNEQNNSCARAFWILVHFFAVLWNQDREMTKFYVVWETRTTTANFSYFRLEVKAVIAHLLAWTRL